jgi:membrane protease YdiL (CAAX protease family)
MNKKQLIVAWAAGIIISLVWALWWFDPATTTPGCLLVSHIITFVIGGLLIYTLKNKKK